MRLTQSDLDSIDLERLRPYVAGPNTKEFFDQREHYRLLALLSTHVPPGKTIVDVGTCYGDSALALSYSGHSIESFDVVDRVGVRPLPVSVHCTISDLFDPVVREKYEETLIESGAVLIDIAPHAGHQELEMVRWFQARDYRGFIILDDTWWYKEMRDNLWYRVEPHHRTDVTKFGHWSGTGIVSFGKNIDVEDAPDTSDWTLVTGYFDLTKTPDANNALRARDPKWYLETHGTSVLSLDKNLVIYCDPEFEAQIWKARPAWLHYRTRVIPISFEDFPLTKHRGRIIENRGGAIQCPSDPRATASYYLFCMARYAMMRTTIEDNPFRSTHFGWIDLGIERMGFQNLIHLDETLGVHRDRFSSCFIDYVSRELVTNLQAYFGGTACAGRCSFSSGFFTGNAKYMLEFCNEIEAEFMCCLGAGYGHADEQLYPIVYYRRPELFDWYVGDYTEIITNYAWVRELPGSPIKNLIRNSFAAGNYDVYDRARSIILNSVMAGKCAVTSEEYVALMRTKDECR